MSDGIVPVYMNKDWQRMRTRLRDAARSAEVAAAASTIEEVARNLGEASIALIDADFARRHIERDRERGKG
jgi:hypothetical protein